MAILSTAKVYENRPGLYGVGPVGLGGTTVRPTQLPGMGSMSEGLSSYIDEKITSAVESIGASIKDCESRFRWVPNPALAMIPMPVLNPFYSSPQCANYRREVENARARLAGRASAGAPGGLKMPPTPAAPDPTDPVAIRTPDQDALMRETNARTRGWLDNYFANVNVPDVAEEDANGGTDGKTPGVSMWVWVGVGALALLALNKR